MTRHRHGGCCGFRDDEKPCPPDHPWYNANPIDWSAFDPTMEDTTLYGLGVVPTVEVTYQSPWIEPIPDLDDALFARAEAHRTITHLLRSPLEPSKP